MAQKTAGNPQEMAEIVAIRALSFLAQDPERLGQFLSESGIGPETLRASASDASFLSGVLDFVLRDDASVKAFSEFSQLPLETITAARMVLDGYKPE